MVTRSETSTLWRKVGLLDVVSPRAIAAERIRDYIDSNYQPRVRDLLLPPVLDVQEYASGEALLRGLRSAPAGLHGEASPRLPPLRSGSEGRESPAPSTFSLRAS